MKTKCPQILGSALLIAICFLLNTSSAQAADRKAADFTQFHGRVQVNFLKWVKDMPNMSGVVSGDVGAGLFVGEVLNEVDTATTTKVDALYHINGNAFQFTAHNHVLQDNIKGTAVIHGVVKDGPLKGAKVLGEYHVVSPCGIINAQNGDAGDVCFQGTLTVTF